MHVDAAIDAVLITSYCFVNIPIYLLKAYWRLEETKNEMFQENIQVTRLPFVVIFIYHITYF